MNKFSNNSFHPGYCTIDCYGADINNRHLGKVNLGLIHEFFNMSDKLEKMLGELGTDGLNLNGQNATRRKDSLRSFKFECFHDFFLVSGTRYYIRGILVY